MGHDDEKFERRVYVLERQKDVASLAAMSSSPSSTTSSSTGLVSPSRTTSGESSGRHVGGMKQVLRSTWVAEEASENA
jgi:hypothetical protein